MLATIYRDRELHSESAADRGIVQCVAKLQDLNEQLQKIPVSVLPLCSASQAIHLLLKQIAELPPVNIPVERFYDWLYEDPSD